MNKADSHEALAIIAALKKSYVFQKAHEDDLALLGMRANWVSLPDQSILLKEGEAHQSLYVLAQGKLIVKEAVTVNTELIIARITPGDVVAELGFIDSRPASATVRTDGASDLVCVKYDVLRAIFTETPRLELVFFKELVETLSDRLRRSNLDLRRSLLSTSVGRY